MPYQFQWLQHSGGFLQWCAADSLQRRAHDKGPPNRMILSGWCLAQPDRLAVTRCLAVAQRGLCHTLEAHRIRYTHSKPAAMCSALDAIQRSIVLVPHDRSRVLLLSQQEAAAATAAAGKFWFLVLKGYQLQTKHCRSAWEHWGGASVGPLGLETTF
jgi:hypothetical protein